MKILPNWWCEKFLIIELLVVLLLTVCFVFWYYQLNGSNELKPFLDGNRTAIYSTLATIFGSILGFVITATSIIIGFSASEKLSIVKNSKHYKTLWKVFSSTIRALSFAVVIAFLSLILDRDNRPCSILLFFMFFTLFFSLVRIWRTIWVLENIIEIITTNSKPIQ